MPRLEQELPLVSAGTDLRILELHVHLNDLRARPGALSVLAAVFAATGTASVHDSAVEMELL